MLLITIKPFNSTAWRRLINAYSINQVASGMDTIVSADDIEFGVFRLDRRGGRLMRCDESGALTTLSLGTRSREILYVLIDRAGEVVSRQEIMDAVWGGVAVEENNLTVQLSALRRILDEGRTGGSCIETVPGRGYRFVEPVRQTTRAEVAVAGTQNSKPRPGTRSLSRREKWPWIPVAVAAAIFVAAVVVWGGGRRAEHRVPPRLSLVVMPFRNLSGDHEANALADGITADLTSDLARVSQVTITAAPSTNNNTGGVLDPPRVGRSLDVRYVVEGSVREVGKTLRLDVQLISTETGTELWSDRFDETLAEPDASLEHVAARLRTGLRDTLIGIESARADRERPDAPDAFDLVLRAQAIMLRSPDRAQERQVAELYRRALARDPSYMPALVGSAYFLTDRMSPWQVFGDMRQAENYALKAREIAPTAPEPAHVYMYWLKSVGRCPEVIELGRQFGRTDPEGIRSIVGIASQLGQCLAQTGHAEEDIALQQQAMESDPRSRWTFDRFRAIGYDQLLLGRYQDAITSLQRSLAINPAFGSSWRYFGVAAAYAATGQIDQARRVVAEANRLWPYFTVRSVDPNYSPNPVYRAQLRRVQDELRLAGARDHADENADFGVPSDRELHRAIGLTPKDALGVTTVGTADLSTLRDDARVIVIDTMTNSWGQSIPGAFGLKFVGLGGDFSDEAQGRLRSKMSELTGGNLHRPIVAMGWNSEHFDGRNLALRLTALGYSHVYWYRGGREAWEAAGLPETDIRVEDW
jgi:adenylate cyclase